MTHQPKSYKKFVATAATATLVASAIVPVASAAETKNFTDVSKNYKEAVDYLVANGITEGKTSTTFGTVENITRGDAAVFIARALKLDTADAADQGFKDLNSRVAGAVNAIVAEGIANGKTETTFDPSANITRQEMAKMLAKAYGLEAKTTADFTDVNSNWLGYVSALKEAGITLGKTETTFAPLDNLSRGEFALFIFRAEGGETKPEVPEAVENYELKISTAKATITADGADNTVVTVQVVDKKTGAVATNADDIVVKVDTTFGTLANERLTVQDGKATVLLTSEFSQRDLKSILTATLIETKPESDWYEHIGLVATSVIDFKAASGAAQADTEITGAESNQADRLTVFFNKEVEPQMFYPKNDKAPEILIGVGNNGDDKEILGFKAVPGNKKAIEVILVKEEKLANNSTVEVAQVIDQNKVIFKDFILTDARQPEATSVKQISYNKLEVTFSESVEDIAAATIDGGTIKVLDVTPGEFHVKTGLDKRNTAIITTEKFIPAGKHSLQLAGTKDFAGQVSTNQTFDFVVPGSDVVPASTFKVESPEQFRFALNTLSVDKNGNSVTAAYLKENVKFQKYNKETKVWEAFDVAFGDLAVDIVYGSGGKEAIFELKKDWTEIFGTETTNDNYFNHQFRAVVEKDVFQNPANEKKNAKQVIDLNYEGSALNNPDTTSPEIAKTPSDILDENGNKTGKYLVTFNEPVKIPGKDNAGDTPSQLQGATLPELIVEFIGTDKDGNKKTVKGNALDYDLFAYGEDNAIIVAPAAADALQKHVDTDGYSSSWQLVVRNVTDDVGNAASTLTANFLVEKNSKPANDFKLDTDFDGNGVKFFTDANNDYVELEFTSAVTFTGDVENATDVSNYTVNGKNLPKGTVATIHDLDNDKKNGYESVVLTLPKGSLEAANNTINLSKSLQSNKGLVISGPTEVADVLVTPGKPAKLN